MMVERKVAALSRMLLFLKYNFKKQNLWMKSTPEGKFGGLKSHALAVQRIVINWEIGGAEHCFV